MPGDLIASQAVDLRTVGVLLGANQLQKPLRLHIVGPLRLVHQVLLQRKIRPMRPVHQVHIQPTPDWGLWLKLRVMPDGRRVI